MLRKLENVTDVGSGKENLGRSCHGGVASMAGKRACSPANAANTGPGARRFRQVKRDWQCATIASSGLTIVVVEESAEALAAFDLAIVAAYFFPRRDQAIVKPLVITLGMVMRQELRNGFAQR